MITENGIVTAANESIAWIKTTRHSACKSCANRDSCGGGSGKSMTLTVKNTLGVSKGDRVTIGLETKSMIFLAFFLYVFPVLCLIGGALLGDFLSPHFSLSPSAMSLLFGGGCFALAFFVIRKTHDRLVGNDSYKPFLVKKNPVSPRTCGLS